MSEVKAPAKFTLAQAFDAAFRLRRAVVQISERQPSHARSVIDQFLKFIAPSMASNGGADFPITCRRTPLDPERSSMDTPGKFPLLYFHIGNAVLGFYDCLAGKPTAVFESRLALLQSIAAYELEDFVPYGDNGAGYRLINKVELRKLLEAERALSDAKQAETGEPATA